MTEAGIWYIKAHGKIHLILIRPVGKVSEKSPW